MTQEQIKQIRDQIQKICFYRGLIKETEGHLNCMISWNKVDSHDNAIKIDVDKLKEFRAKLKEVTADADYEKLLKISKEISKFNSRISSAKQTLKRAEQALIDYNPFEPKEDKKKQNSVNKIVTEDNKETSLLELQKQNRIDKLAQSFVDKYEVSYTLDTAEHWIDKKKVKPEVKQRFLEILEPSNLCGRL